ncbi:monovalent cation:proton antiporter-2 (CPA2) family protein [Desulfopila sp. IMCC35008]|uniref:monovalent cation:proton antiporter-2 (CPA2) family protein n=1 Tax=Desulfopila sp. IMCC35008 TaxID=2653858 RepID=UPI0013D8DECB|nr:monovalent cation:proton antiporter-2 (CPA2) family protein [Desulfopila sp. IMCC35008]
MEHFLLQFFIFLAAAAFAVPLAKKCGLGSVLGYLIAGIVIGPFGLSLINEIEEVMHFTEFGVVMMLFLVGLELKPSLLWQMRVPILGMGGAQVVVSSLALAAVGLAYLPWQQAVAVGMILALSSTAIALQTLREKGLMNSAPGRSIFSVLLFQDLAVIPMLALLPLLAIAAPHGGDHHGSALFDITQLPGYQRLLITLLAIVSIYLLGRFGSRPLFRTIAATRVREIFVAAALALVVGISLLMTAVGLSPALGTFLAGVVLADSEYRHELESDIEPFKGLLLGIFFISIGASLNFTLIGDQIALISGLVLGLLFIKWLILFSIGLLFKMEVRERWLFSLALAQGGEFAFVLFQFAGSNGVLPAAILAPLISAVAISMFLAPLLFLLYEKVIVSRLRQDDLNKRDADTINRSDHRVILAGFGRLGTDLGRFLITAGIKPVILDHDAANVDVLRKFGFEVYYGDVTRLDLLEAAGAAEAELLVITIGNTDKALELVELVRKHYPNLKIAANAADRSAAYQLMDLGVTNIRRETFGSALSLGQESLKLLGTDPYEAYKLMRLFSKKDEDSMPELYAYHREDEENYISMYRKHNNDLAELMSFDEKSSFEELEKAWATGNPEE